MLSYGNLLLTNIAYQIGLSEVLASVSLLLMPMREPVISGKKALEYQEHLQHQVPVLETKFQNKRVGGPK